MKICDRKSVMETLKVFVPMAGENDYIEVVEWPNGEGWDITITEGTASKHISLHLDELEAINLLTKCLDYKLDIKHS